MNLNVVFKLRLQFTKKGLYPTNERRTQKLIL